MVGDSVPFHLFSRTELTKRSAGTFTIKMKIEQRSFEVYEFDELSEGAKQKALEQFRYINVDYDDWWLCDDRFRDLFMDAGLELGDGWEHKMYFDLDRGSYVFFDKGVLSVDINKFFGNRIPKKLLKNIEHVSVGVVHYGGGYAKNTIEAQMIDGFLGSEAEVDEIGQKILDEVMDRLLKMLRDDYNGLTSDEAVIDAIRANEYQFLKNGKHFTL